MTVLILASSIIIPIALLLAFSEGRRIVRERAAWHNAMVVERDLAAAKRAGTFKPKFKEN